jgi:hypothetical protein
MGAAPPGSMPPDLRWIQGEDLAKFRESLPDGSARSAGAIFPREGDCLHRLEAYATARSKPLCLKEIRLHEGLKFTASASTAQRKTCSKSDGSKRHTSEVKRRFGFADRPKPPWPAAWKRNGPHVGPFPGPSRGGLELDGLALAAGRPRPRDLQHPPPRSLSAKAERSSITARGI